MPFNSVALKEDCAGVKPALRSEVGKWVGEIKPALGKGKTNHY